MTDTALAPDNSKPGLLDDYLTERQFAEENDRSLRTIQRWRELGKGPKATEMPGGQRLYRRDTVREWLLNLEEDRG